VHEAASQAIRAELGPGERILAEGPAVFMFTDGVSTVWPEVSATNEMGGGAMDKRCYETPSCPRMN
jgi:hypothetical protein